MQARDERQEREPSEQSPTCDRLAHDAIGSRRHDEPRECKAADGVDPVLGKLPEKDADPAPNCCGYEAREEVEAAEGT